MIIIEHLSNKLSEIEKEIDKSTHKLMKGLVSKKPVSINNNINDIPKQTSGCYLFEIQIINEEYVANNFKNFMDKWHKHKNNGYKIPSFNKSNAKEVCQKINRYTKNWFPLYIGKAEGLRERIEQHIQCKTPTTYALRLRLFNNANNGFNFQVKWIVLPPNITHYCEKNIHKRLHPLIGKG